jgi:hypothetical protein
MPVLLDLIESEIKLQITIQHSADAAGWSGVRISVEVGFSMPMLTGPQSQPAYCTMHTGILSLAKRPVR